MPSWIQWLLCAAILAIVLLLMVLVSVAILLYGKVSHFLPTS